MKIFIKEIHTEEHHPSTVKESREFKAIAKVENQEFNEVGELLQLIIDNYYIQTLTTYGLEQWEEILDLVPWATDTIEQRREAVELTLKSQLPYTLRQLKIMLANICGADGYTLDIDYNRYNVDIRVSLGVKRSRDLVENMVRQVLPMNLNYKVDLLYNRHIDLEIYTHETMEQWTHDDLQSEVLTGA